MRQRAPGTERNGLEVRNSPLSFRRVNRSLPSVTVLIAARPEQAEIRAVTASKRLDYPKDKLELLVARGKQPSTQRNAGIREASGQLVYFLDDDSVPEPGNLRLAVSHFEDQKVQVVGGPNLCPPDAPLIERIFALVLSSWLAFGPSRARYTPIGKLRATSEKELILCNLIARRGTLLELGGFDEALYPNEENALMDTIQNRANRLLYDPSFIVRRRPRPHLKAFGRMLMTYGRGRAEQFRVHPTPGSALNFVPPLFVLYLVLLPAMVAFFGPLPLSGLVLYAAAALIEGALLVLKAGLAGFGAIPLVVLTHLLYGLGFWRGLFTSLHKGAGETTPVVLERVPL